MSRFRLRHHLGIAVTLVASAACLALGTGVFNLAPASADPPYSTISSPVVAMGSNTIEDVFNAFSGEEPTPGVGVSPVLTPSTQLLEDPTTGTRVYSYDAENPSSPATVNVGCVTTKLNGPSFDRVNGSTNGRVALSDALTGFAWYEANACSGDVAPGVVLTTGTSFDVARSNSPPPSNFTGNEGQDNGTKYNTYVPGTSGSNNGPSAAICTPTGASNPTVGDNTATTGFPCLTYVPFAHDAETYAYWAGSAVPPSAVAQLSSSGTLTTLFNGTAGTQTVNPAGVVSASGAYTLHACLPQTTSGVVSFFVGAIGDSVANASASATDDAANGFECVNYEQNSGNDFVNFVNALTNNAGPSADAVYITPISVGSYVAQANGAAQDRSNVFRGFTAANQAADCPATNPETGTGPETCPVIPAGQSRALYVPTFASSATPPSTTDSNGTSYADLGDPDNIALTAASTDDEAYDVSGATYGADTTYDAEFTNTTQGTWGQNLYVVVPWAALNGGAGLGNPILINLFGTCNNASEGGSAALCAGSFAKDKVSTSDGVPVICEGLANPASSVAGPQDLLAKFGFVTESTIQGIQGTPNPTPNCGQEIPLNAIQGPGASYPPDTGLQTAGSAYATPGHE